MFFDMFKANYIDYIENRHKLIFISLQKDPFFFMRAPYDLSDHLLKVAWCNLYMALLDWPSIVYGSAMNKYI